MDICDVHKIMAGPVWPSATLPFTLVPLLAMLWMVATRCGFTTGDAIQLCTNTLWESLNKMFPHITSEANEVHHYWGGQWFSNPSNKNTDGKFVQQAAHYWAVLIASLWFTCLGLEPVIGINLPTDTVYVNVCEPHVPSLLPLIVCTHCLGVFHILLGLYLPILKVSNTQSLVYLPPTRNGPWYLSAVNYGAFSL